MQKLKFGSQKNVINKLEASHISKAYSYQFSLLKLKLTKKRSSIKSNAAHIIISISNLAETLGLPNQPQNKHWPLKLLPLHKLREFFPG